MSVLNRRTIATDLVYTSERQENIAKALIDYAQGLSGGDLSIIANTVTTGVLRDRTYLAADLKPVGEAIEELAAVDDGFEFRFDYVKAADSTMSPRFTTSYPATRT